jgi:hypothetical protein
MSFRCRLSPCFKFSLFCFSTEKIIAVQQEKLNTGETKKIAALMKKEIKREEEEMLYCGNHFRKTQSLAAKKCILFYCQYNPSPSYAVLLFFQTIHSSTKGKPLN